MMKFGLAVFAVFAFSVPAHAGTSDNPFAADKATIDLKGLDLATVDGQQRLAIRVDQAARSVCGDNLASVHLALAAQAQECRALVMADVRTRIEARMATAATRSAVHVAAR